MLIENDEIIYFINLLLICYKNLLHFFVNLLIYKHENFRSLFPKFLHFRNYKSYAHDFFS